MAGGGWFLASLAIPILTAQVRVGKKVVPSPPFWINFSNINVGWKRAVPSVLVGCTVIALVWAGKRVVSSLPFGINSSSFSVGRKRADLASLFVVLLQH